MTSQSLSGELRLTLNRENVKFKAVFDGENVKYRSLNSGESVKT